MSPVISMNFFIISSVIVTQKLSFKPICIGYEIDGEITKDFPTTSQLAKAKPVYKMMQGWKTEIRGIKNYEELPKECREYIEFIEKELEVPITMVSNGPGRDEIIYRK